MIALLKRRRGRERAFPFAVALVCACALFQTGSGTISAGKPAIRTVVIEGLLTSGNHPGIERDLIQIKRRTETVAHDSAEL